IPGFDQKAFSNIKTLYEQYNFMIIFTAGFTPIPFKLFTISAGAFGIQFPLFLLAGAISRSARFLLVAYLIKKFGRPITNFIDEYFNLLAILFTVLLFGGFFLIEFFL
ncbi:MAG: DedA family protein, partial [Candidatus Marinimicrobia bacterium]|nr:DedA family protein [Candidatus Neomarinimicrobiota bacterium]